MNLRELLGSIELDKNDVNKWWELVIEQIKSDLDYFSDKDRLIEFLNDYISLLEKEIAFWNKYWNIYNENFSISREFEKSICNQILSKI